MNLRPLVVTLWKSSDFGFLQNWLDQRKNSITELTLMCMCPWLGSQERSVSIVLKLMVSSEYVIKKRTNFLRKKLVGSDSQLRITDYYRFHSENSFQWDNYNTFLEKNIPCSKVKSSQAEMKHVIYQISVLFWYILILFVLSQIIGRDLAKFCGLLRIHELQ